MSIYAGYVQRAWEYFVKRQEMYCMLACFVCCLARCAIVHSYKLLKLVLDYKDSVWIKEIAQEGKSHDEYRQKCAGDDDWCNRLCRWVGRQNAAR